MEQIILHSKNHTKRRHDTYESIVHLWNGWNRQYLDAEFPRLIVRYEDTIFHAEEVMKMVSECAGVPLASPFKYMSGRAKHHGKSLDFLHVLEKTGNRSSRLEGYSKEDLGFIQETIDGELMRVFNYSFA